jgi:hypothetical protein
MTMILTYLTKDYVVQASDRRLTYPSGQKKEQSNKALIYRNRFAFAYTGLAEFPIRVNGKLSLHSTIEWAADRLSEGKDLDDGVEQLRSQLSSLMNTNQVRKIPPERRRLAFVGAGFEEVEEAGQMVRKPRRIVISNFLENDGTMLSYPRDMFTIDSYWPEDDRYISLCISGQQLSDQRRIELTKILKLCVQHEGPETVGHVLSSEIKAVSRGGNDFVGEDVICTIVPQAFVDTDDGSMMVHGGIFPFSLPVPGSQSQQLRPVEDIPDRRRFAIPGSFDSPRCFYISGDGKPFPHYNVIHVSPGQVVPPIIISDISLNFTSEP